MRRRKRRAVQDNEFTHYKSVREFADGVRAAAAAMAARVDDDWAGGTLADALGYCKNGDTAHVAAALGIANAINDAVDVAGVRQEWTPDVVGAFPCVPAYLAGDPCSMWARSPVQDERGELDAFINLGASAKTKARDMQRRGVAVLSLLLALQRVRNVRAHFYTDIEAANMTVDFSYPFDVSELAAFCTEPVIYRRLVLAPCCAALGGTVPVADWSERNTGRRETEIRALRDFAGVGSDSLVITSRLGMDLASRTDGELIETINGMIEAVNAGRDINGVFG